MSTIRNGDVEIFYEDVGQGRPVLFVHGWTMTHELWDRQVGAFCESYRCISVDLRGHGYSTKPASNYAYADHVDDLLSLITSLDLHRLTIVGSSFGGAVAIALADVAPARVAQIVTAGTPPKLIATPEYPQGRPESDLRQLIESQRTAREQTMRQIVLNSVHQELDPAAVDWLFHLALQMPSWAAVASWGAILASDVRPELARLSVPILVTQGVHDQFVTNEAAERMAKTAPDARLEWFSDSGHFPFLEEPDAFNKALTSFLKEVD